MKKLSVIWSLFILIIFLTSDIASAKNRADYERTGHVIWEVDTNEKIVAITFDDGPHPYFTPQILNILAKHNAKATFFVTGLKAKLYPKIIKRELKEGHEVANHTYHHINNSHISAEKLSAEIAKTDEILKKIIGYKPDLFRPVAGHYNDVIVNTAVENEKLVVLWSWHQDPQDWKEPPASRIRTHITKSVRPGNIIVLHDWHKRETSQTCQTVMALDGIVDTLTKEGYQFVTVSELLYRSKTKVPPYFNPFH
jgi:peptidoglycan/xylan/chitin deacetylase (PgdA/CDA1 family)